MMLPDSGVNLRPLWVVGGLVGTGVLVYLLSPILMPFLVAAGLAYLGDPIVDRLEDRGLSRTAGVCAVFAVLTVLGLVILLLIFPLLQDQLLTLFRRIPDYLAWIESKIFPLLGIESAGKAAFDVEAIRALVKQHWIQAGGMLSGMFGSIGRSGSAVMLWVSNLLLIPVVSFYLLRDWDVLVERVANLIPRRQLPVVTQLAKETDEVMGAFLRGQLSVMAALSVIYSVGLSIIGLDFALLIGLGAGLVSFVPYLGFVVGFISAGAAMFLQTQELLPLLWVLLVFGVGQLLESMLLTPLLVGDRIGLHPVAVIFAIMAGGQLFGFVGILVALPAAAALAVYVRHGIRQWLDSELYQQLPAGAAAPVGSAETADSIQEDSPEVEQDETSNSA